MKDNEKPVKQGVEKFGKEIIWFFNIGLQDSSYVQFYVRVELIIFCGRVTLHLKRRIM